MGKAVDVVYVVASKLGSVGMGTAAYNAIKGIQKFGKFSFRVFCRGHNRGLGIEKRKIISYGFLEFLSYPFRFIEKKLKIKINSFKLVNSIFGKLVNKNIPPSKIYHTWMGISFEAIIKAKKSGAVLVLEGANSHPVNSLTTLNDEYTKLGMKDFILDTESLRDQLSVINLFDYIMCPSEFVYDSFLEYGFSKKKLIKIPYGVNLQKFDSPKKKDNKFRAIFVGSVQVRKGAHYLMQAWNELNLKNAELLIVGTIYPDMVKIVSKYKKNPSIKFLNFNPNLQKYYLNADVFVFPSLEEGSSLVNYEAMASGLPVITTFNSGSIVRDGKDGFIIPIRNINSIKKRIKYLYDNPTVCQSMGMSAKNYIKNYSWEKYGEQLTIAYEKIMKKQHKN